MKKILSIVAIAAMLFALSVPAFAATPSVEYTVEAVDATVLESITVDDSVAELDDATVQEMHENTEAENLEDVAEVNEDVLAELQEKTGNAELTVEDITVELEVKPAEVTVEQKADLVDTIKENLVSDKKLEDITQSVKTQIDSGSIQGVQATNGKGEVVKSVKVSDVQVTLAQVDLVYKVDGQTISNVSKDNFPEGGLKVAIAYTDKLEDNQAILDVMRYNEDNGAWESVGAGNFDYDAKSGKVNVTFDHLCAVAFVLGTVEAVYAPAETEEPTEEETGKTDTSGTGTATKNDPSKSPQTGYDVFGWAAAVSALVFAAGYCFVSARKVTE
jgi:hypothetical protein